MATKEQKAQYMRNYRAAHPEVRKYFRDYQMQWNRSLNGRYSYAVSKAKSRGHEFSLTLEEYESLLKDSKCHCCYGLAPETSCGLDRMDNNKGYVSGNVVVCCWNCNSMKSKYLTYDEMKLIWALRRKKAE